ncbi:major facilitator superfamily domain-containing protein [Kalaharituber pfeilii]|nr:major facilitator superfamily domain-containing protein [Kalaharituber pfeilii]
MSDKSSGDSDTHNEEAGISKKLRSAEMELKYADNGIALTPQPTADPKDPLNWSSTKKNAILLTVALGAYAADFGSGADIPCIVKQGIEWNMTPNEVNYSGNLNLIFLGIGGLFWIPVIYFWGRAPVLFWTTLSGTLFTLGCCVTTDFQTYYAMRALMGFTLTAPQTIGLAFIKDMFFFHEHARKIGIWAAVFLVAPYCGPLFGNFIVDGTGEWRPVFWLVFAFCCFVLVLIVLFIDETWYNRNIPMDKQPERGSTEWDRMMRLTGIWQIKHHSGYFLPVLSSCKRLTTVLFKPIMLPTMCYYMMSFMWAIGINITISILLETPQAAGGYGFNAKAIGYTYFTPLVGVAIGEAFGHFFNDFVANRYIRKHNGEFKPEVRLWINYISFFFMPPGLVLIGQTLHRHLHWSALVMGWGMYVFGVMAASVGVTAYTLDCYPNASGEVGGYINFARAAGGFIVGYFQMPWGMKVGYDVSFGTQAGIVTAAVILLIIIQRFGRIWREKGGQVEFEF